MSVIVQCLQRVCILLGSAGVRCGGELHGGIHQAACETERLRGRDHGATGTGWGDQPGREGGRPGVRVDGQLPAGKSWITASVIAVGMNIFLHFVLSHRRLLLLSARQSEPPLGFLLLSDALCGSSLSSWWSRCCWQETAGWGKAAWFGLRRQHSFWCHARPTAITQRKWCSGRVPMVWTSLLFSKHNKTTGFLHLTIQRLSCPDMYEEALWTLRSYFGSTLDPNTGDNIYLCFPIIWFSISGARKLFDWWASVGLEIWQEGRTRSRWIECFGDSTYRRKKICHGKCRKYEL